MLSLFYKRLEDINEDDILSLIENAEPEGKYLDYKEKLPEDKNNDKIEFCKDVVSFANAEGGIIIYGIKENKNESDKTGLPGEIVGVEIENYDKLIQKLENWIRVFIEPRFSGVYFRQLEVKKKKILLVKIIKSWYGPHWVRDDNRFHIRTNSGRQQMSIDELRTAFNLSDTRIERIRKFIYERVSMIYTNEFYYPLKEGPKLIFHTIPLYAFESRSYKPLTEIPQFVDEKLSGFIAVKRINLDGCFYYYKDNQKLKSYIQLFRNFIIEYVDTSYFGMKEISQGEKIYYLRSTYESSLIELLKLFIEIYKELSIPTPILIFLTLVNVEKCKIRTINGHDSIYYFDRDIVNIPEIIVENYDDEPPEKILKPCFDAVWNACGFLRSFNYDDKGNFLL